MKLSDSFSFSLAQWHRCRRFHRLETKNCSLKLSVTWSDSILLSFSSCGPSDDHCEQTVAAVAVPEGVTPIVCASLGRRPFVPSAAKMKKEMKMVGSAALYCSNHQGPRQHHYHRHNQQQQQQQHHHNSWRQLEYRRGYHRCHYLSNHQQHC